MLPWVWLRRTETLPVFLEILTQRMCVGVTFAINTSKHHLIILVCLFIFYLGCAGPVLPHGLSFSSCGYVVASLSLQLSGFPCCSTQAL